MKNLSNMSDSEFFSEIEMKYGKDWTPSDLDPESELYREYIKRISTGVNSIESERRHSNGMQSQ